MKTYIAFIRGINVGGNSTLQMKELAAICVDIGFKEVRTYINSGNVLFESALNESVLQEKLEQALMRKMKKEIKAVIRDSDDLKRIVSKNPFPDAVPSQVGVLLTTESIPKKIIAEFSGADGEEIFIGKKEIYVHYPNGMGRTKLKWPVSLKNGTMRNINTLTKLIQLHKSL